MHNIEEQKLTFKDAIQALIEVSVWSCQVNTQSVVMSLDFELAEALLFDVLKFIAHGVDSRWRQTDDWLMMHLHTFYTRQEYRNDL